ncbi:MAG: hypothetical protein JXA62_06660 [Candidatus Aminicenantes bacterium]|nr:hypothetical protein [Candidatus Aminicenantes bacterium]
MRGRLVFDFRYRAIDWLGAGFIVFGLLVYPVLLYLPGHSLQTTISLGLPCPSIILTLGIFLLVSGLFNRWLIVIPALWAAIGTGAAVTFKVYPDFVMPISVLSVLVFVFTKKKQAII